MKKKELQLEREEWRRREYRRLILKAAERIIGRKGLSAMTMDDVAREAEFSKATLYQYFRSKGQLMLEILMNFYDEIEQGVRRISARPGVAGEKLKEGIRFYLRYNRRKENISQMLMMDRAFQKKMTVIVSDRRKLTSEADRRFLTETKAKRLDILAAVAGIIEAGVASGEFRAIDIPGAVTVLESLLQGYCHLRLWLDRPYSVDEAADLIYGFFLRGIGRAGGMAKGES
jgi:AcrR family transcriptional regulator